MTAPSYEQLAALVAAQERTIAQLQDRLAVQDARLVAQDVRIVEQDERIAELERQLASLLGKPSQPPSSDGPGKPTPMSLRGRSGRKPVPRDPGQPPAPTGGSWLSTTVSLVCNPPLPGEVRWDVTTRNVR